MARVPGMVDWLCKGLKEEVVSQWTEKVVAVDSFLYCMQRLL